MRLLRNSVVVHDVGGGAGLDGEAGGVSVVVHDVGGGAGLDGEAGGGVHTVGQCMLSVG